MVEMVFGMAAGIVLANFSLLLIMFKVSDRNENQGKQITPEMINKKIGN